MVRLPILVLLVLLCIGAAVAVYFVKSPVAEAIARARVERINAGARRFEGSPVTFIEFGECAQADDETLKFLESFPSVRRLNLSYLPNVTDRGMDHVGQLRELTELELWGVPITNDGLARLTKLEQLRVLRFTDTRIDGHGMQYLRAFPNLEELSMHGQTITVDDMGCLEGMKRLRKLHLHATRLEESGLKYLSGLGGLEELSIGEISVAGLSHLRSMKKLQQLWLSGSLSHADVEDLRKSLPRTNIRGWGHED